MSADLVSRRLRLLLSDWLSSNSVLREIENEFEAEGVAYKPDPSQNTGGQRRTMVQGYYNGLNFSDARDARKFFTVLSVFMRQMESYASATSDTATLDHFRTSFVEMVTPTSRAQSPRPLRPPGSPTPRQSR